MHQNPYDLVFLKSSSDHIISFSKPCSLPTPVQFMCELTPVSARHIFYSLAKPKCLLYSPCVHSPLPVSQATARVIPLTWNILPTSPHSLTPSYPKSFLRLEARSDNASQIKTSQSLYLHLNSIPRAIFLGTQSADLPQHTDKSLNIDVVSKKTFVFKKG